MEEKKQESIPESKFSFISEIHPFTVVFFIILFVVGLTYMIPGGEFVRKEVEALGDKRQLIMPNSFHYIQSVPQSFTKIWTYFMQGAVESADIAFTILLCSGALTAIIATGAVDNGINTLVKKLKNKSYLLIPVLIFAFGLGGATWGMYEDAIPFVIVLAPLMLAMKFDSLVAVMIVQYGVLVGSSACFLNPFAVGIGQALAQVPMTSGFGVRLILWIFMMTGTSIYIMRYALKVKKNPELSLVREDDKKNRLKFQNVSNEDLENITGRQKLVLILLAIGFGIMIYGVIKKHWWFNEIGSIFLFMGVVIPLVGGLKINKVIEKNVEGMNTVMTAILILSASRIITLLLQNSKIMDTMLYVISNSLSGFPKIITVWIMFIVSSVSMVVIQSSSGLAAALMPIIAPLGDVLGISRQIVVTAYHLGTGTLGFWMPWDGISFAMCTLAGINFFKYIKKSAHFVFTFYLPACCIALAVLTIVGFN